MIKGINDKELKIIKNILDNYNNYNFYFYGSRIKGNFSKTSDLDILIKGDSAIPLNTLEELKEVFDKSMLPYIVNFVDFYSIDEKFYKLIENDLVMYNEND
ncbi:MAG: nucleotidyltransferase domain-containing protein [Candidatus Gastranaerophilales bacterium]|nr:nucleotidyltransferase domain-containing protein [Candidatus Gastranaerophilales bacterium]